MTSTETAQKTPPLTTRRTWLKGGLASAVVLTVGGAWLARPPVAWEGGQFSASAQAIWHALGRALLDGTLPTEATAQTQTLAGLLDRLTAAVAALPPHAQAELSQLLTLLGTSVGRRGLAGVDSEWSQASVAEIQAGLQAMRSSRLALRQQAYVALHDLVGAAYFSHPSTWKVLDYPGPMDL